MNDDFGVRVRAKHMAAPFENAAQFLVIVNLAVEDDRDVACFVEYGLAPAGKINNTQAAHSKRNRGSDEQPVIIRATMPNGFHHPARNGFGLFGVFNSNDAANSAHPELLYLERLGSSTSTYRMVFKQILRMNIVSAEQLPEVAPYNFATDTKRHIA